MKTLVSYVLIIALALPVRSQPLSPEGPQKDPVLMLGTYSLRFKSVDPKKRIKFVEPMQCIVDFDYVYLDGYVFDIVNGCSAQITAAKKERDEVCKTSKDAIRTQCASAETALKLDLEKMTSKFTRAESDLTRAEEAHKSELLRHYILEGVISAALLGVISALIVR